MRALSPRTRARLRRQQGGCVEAYRRCVRGDRATVTVSPNGRGSAVALTLAAVKIGDPWWIELEDTPS